jgi:hypothetical protein
VGSLKRLLSVIPEESIEDLSPLIPHAARPERYDSTDNRSGTIDNDNQCEDLLPLETVLGILQTDLESAIQQSQTSYDECTLIMPRPSVLASVVQNEANDAARRYRAHRLSAASAEPSKATISSLWATPEITNRMILYWTSTLAVVVVDEAFPLYCISKATGLGVAERDIGNIFQYQVCSFRCHRAARTVLYWNNSVSLNPCGSVLCCSRLWLSRFRYLVASITMRTGHKELH